MTISFQSSTADGCKAQYPETYHMFSNLSCKLGLKIKTLKQIYNECKLRNRCLLRFSLNSKAQKLYELTSNRDNKHDCVINYITSANGLERHRVKSKCRSILSKEFKETTWNNFLGLKEQSSIVSSTVSSSFAKDITNW